MKRTKTAYLRHMQQVTTVVPIGRVCMRLLTSDVMYTEHCLGNMEHVRGSRALCESSNIMELDARVGLVAVQLGLPDDAARLFAGCERWDLLEQLHQATGSWDAALNVAGKKDR
eukprot:GHUV01045713.1.p2 GENE.GHUV01045713.1~~GHUV01045713.1.p2  ORF type:complete len:114 (+),score=36.77 GHUV01045713.1:121-462(+)